MCFARMLLTDAEPELYKPTVNGETCVTILVGEVWPCCRMLKR